MIKAMKISEIARDQNRSRSLAHYNKNNGKYQRVILPFAATNQFQRKIVNRCLLGVKIITKNAEGKFSEENPCTLEPVERGGKVYLNYWGKKYRYKLPKGAKLLYI